MEIRSANVNICPLLSAILHSILNVLLDLHSVLICYFDNSAKQIEDNEVTPESNYVVIYKDGSCEWEPRYELSVTRCHVDETWFPFDEQTCPIAFMSWLLRDDQLHLSPLPFHDDQPELFRSNQWEVVGKD